MVGLTARLYYRKVPKIFWTKNICFGGRSRELSSRFRCWVAWKYFGLAHWWGGVLWILWYLVLELVECRWDVVGHIQINCSIYVVPLQGESHFFNPVQSVFTGYNNCKEFLRWSASCLFEYFTTKLYTMMAKKIPQEICFHSTGVLSDVKKKRPLEILPDCLRPGISFRI